MGGAGIDLNISVTRHSARRRKFSGDVEITSAGAWYAARTTFVKSDIPIAIASIVEMSGAMMLTRESFVGINFRRHAYRCAHKDSSYCKSSSCVFHFRAPLCFFVAIRNQIAEATG